MKWSLGTRWWTALASRRPPRRRPGDQDPADMGTAFGLDAITTTNSDLIESLAVTGPGAVDRSASARLASRLHRRSTL